MEIQTTRKNMPLTPLKLYEKVFCQRCPDADYCNANTAHKKLCILTLVADELSRTRQLLEHRTRHLSW
ncbi:MAG: hypothetical protein OEY81_06335 [Candidatus Bathyarchaeota archaeon]|nr:hypothetical protein [Candidatus Bathyarchaeota archaeon]